MRRILLAMTVFALCLPAGAEAARRDERAPQPAASRHVQVPTQPAQARPAATTARPGPAAAQGRPAARPVSASAPRSQAARPGEARSSRSGIVVRGASAATVSRPAPGNCRQRNGRTVCASSGVAGWQAGLPRADNAQRECPVGTLATLARGHDDVVRCLPL